MCDAHIRPYRQAFLGGDGHHMLLATYDGHHMLLATYDGHHMLLATYEPFQLLHHTSSCMCAHEPLATGMQRAPYWGGGRGGEPGQERWQMLACPARSCLQHLWFKCP